jgi:uncharacterized protein (DUF2225 family)
LYKISEVADLFGIEKTEVFEKMISHRNLLDPNIHKQDGVTYFTEHGLEILRTLMGIETHSTNTDQEMPDINETIRKSRPLGKVDREKKILLDKMDILIHEINALDQELILKDEMISKYQDKLDDELEAMNRFQSIILKNLENLME